MAVLTDTQLESLRQAFQARLFSPTLTKPQLNAAFQQAEDWFEANREGAVWQTRLT